MWAWLKRFFSTNTPRKQDALEAAFLSQSKAIEKLMARQQDLITQQQATLDRIVTAKFDRPIERTIHPQPQNQMPLFALDDQGSLPEPSEIERGLANLHLDNDKDFLASVQ